jgi:hypothetical protein
VRRFIVSLTSLALAAGLQFGAPVPVRAVDNDNFAGRAELVASTTIDIMTLEDATEENLNLLNICGTGPTNLWNSEGTECYEGSTEND